MVMLTFFGCNLRDQENLLEMKPLFASQIDLAKYYLEQGDYKNAAVTLVEITPGASTARMLTTRELARIHILNGRLNRLTDNYSPAWYYLNQAVELSKQLKDVALQAEALIEMAELYRVLEDYEKAQAVLSDALKISDEHPEKKYFRALIYSRLASVIHDPHEAENYTLLALDHAQKSNNLYLIGLCMNELGMFYRSKATEIPMKYFKEALDFFRRINDRHNGLNTLINIANLLIDREKYHEAIRYLDTVSMKLGDSDLWYIRSSYYGGKVRAYHGLGIYDSVFFYERLMFEYDSSKLAGQQVIKVKQAQLAHELQDMNRILEQQDKEIAYRRFIYLLLVVSLPILLVLLINVVRVNRNLKKNKKVIKQQFDQSVEMHDSLTVQYAEKASLYNELHSRVSANLQLIIDILDFRRRKACNQQLRKAIASGMGRIKSVAMVHRMVYMSESENMINAREYLTQFSNFIIGLMKDRKAKSVEINCPEEICVNQKFIFSLGMILNELMANSMKYANMPEMQLKMSATLRAESGSYYFLYEDNGRGDSNKTSETINENVGFFLMHTLTSQLKGKWEYEFSPGFKARFIFPQSIGSEHIK